MEREGRTEQGDIDKAASVITALIDHAAGIEVRRLALVEREVRLDIETDAVLEARSGPPLAATQRSPAAPAGAAPSRAPATKPVATTAAVAGRLLISPSSPG